MLRGVAARAVCLAGLLFACASTELQPPGGAAGSASAGAAGASGAGSLPALSLQPGQVVELTVTADGTAGERLATPTGSEEFVLVLVSTELDPSLPALGYSLTLGQASRAGPTSLVTTCSLSSAAWSGTKLPSATPPTGPAPLEGTVRSLDVPTPEGGSTISARAISVGEHSVVWMDTSNSMALDSNFVAEFLDDFEHRILPRERAVFGSEPDIDGDGRIHLVFSPLTYRTAVAFFTGCDLASTFAGCPTSNHGEYLYLTPPDAIDPPYNTANAIKEILVHETSHLLHFARKVLNNQLRGWPDSQYMVEGIGGFAQDVIGYQAGNLYVAMAGLDGLDQFSLGETLADGRPYDTGRDGVLRGASYLFVRYLYDRGGADQMLGTELESRGGPAFLRALLDAPDSLGSALPALGQAPIEDIAMDFFTTLALSNREQIGGVAATNPCFAYLPVEQDPLTGNPRGANLFASFHGMRMKGPHVQSGAAADGVLLPGGVELLRVTASSGANELAFTLAAEPRARPRLRVARWK